MLSALAMRRLGWVATLVSLVAATFLLWQFRFERSPEFGTIRLSDLVSTASLPPGAEWVNTGGQLGLKLRMDPSQTPVVVRFELPGMKAVDFLHLRVQGHASNLKPGPEPWSEGRCMIEWHPVDGGTDWENDPFISAKYDQKGGVMELVTRPDHPPAVPSLRIEHLGVSGDFLLDPFEATVLQERLVWKIGRWVLMAAWLAWVICWIGFRGKHGFVRALSAASIWLTMGLYFVLPGPWKSYRAFGAPFQIGEEIRHSPPPAAAPAAPPVSQPAALESVGKIPLKGDLTLSVKYYAEKVRPMLHIILLFVPAFLIACLVGRRSALYLSVLMALGIEAAQVAFGYGFDWVDCFDLLFDGIGIALALAAHRHFTRILPGLVSRWQDARAKGALPLEQ